MLLIAICIDSPNKIIKARLFRRAFLDDVISQSELTSVKRVQGPWGPRIGPKAEADDPLSSIFKVLVLVQFFMLKVSKNKP